MNKYLTFDDVQILPGYSEVESRNKVDTRTILSRDFWIETPLLAAPMDSVCGDDMMVKLMQLGAAGCLHRFMDPEEQESLIRSVKQYRDAHINSFGWRSPIIASVGVTGDFIERAERTLFAGADIILIDVAHGDHVNVKNALRLIKRYKGYDYNVIAGNIATAAAAERLQEWGADALRVGIGGGSMCETRVRTGVGVPQLSAVEAVHSVATVPIISDGGIKLPGDVAKALAAGADTVMLGSLFSGTYEAPGDIFETGQWPNVKKMKVFRGSASASAKYSVKGAADYVEGTATMVPAKGSVETVVKTIMDGVRSSMSYVGASTLSEFRAKAEFIQITNAGLVEAHPHGLR